MADRKYYVISGFRCMVFSALWLTLEAKAGGVCGSSPTHIDVTSSGGVLYSPGYPEEYPNSVTCTWILHSKEPGKVLQLRPLDLQLGIASTRDSGACAGDVLTAYDGPKITFSVLHNWCEVDVKVVYSTGASALLIFDSDRHRRYRGFAIRYSLLTLSDNSCESDTVRTLPLQSGNPVVVDFTPPPSRSHLPSTCSWRLVADDVRSQVVIDLDTLNEGLPCEDGNFSVYDGPELSSPEVLHWCAPTAKPFSSVFLSGGQGMVVIRTRPDVTSVLRFRFHTRPKIFPHCSLSSMPTVELNEEDPVYISFPFAVNDSGVSCPVQVLSAVTHTLWARLDVLKTVGGYLPSCHSSEIPPFTLQVLQTNGTDPEKDDDDNIPATLVEPSCLKGNQPVYWPIAEVVIVSPPKDSRGMLLKITPASYQTCHGRQLRMRAPTDKTLVIKDPPDSVRTLQYSRSSWCRYVVSGQHETDHVLVNIEGELCEKTDICGDYVKLYDGPSTDSPVLYDSENRTHVTVHVISTGRHVTLEWGTDDRLNQGFIQADFNSVPGPELCSEVQQIKASYKSQNLSSINYPYYYPVKYMCQYCITSENPDDVIHIKVIDSDLTYSCSDVVEVYDGADSAEAAGVYLGRFCAQERPRFVSQGPGLCLLFRSDNSHHGRGWLLSYRAATSSSAAVVHRHGTFNGTNADNNDKSSSSNSTTTTTATAVVALVVLVAVIVVFIAYIFKNKRRERSPSV